MDASRWLKYGATSALASGLWVSVTLASPLVATPELVDAGEVPAGSTSLQSFELQNTGSESLLFEFPGLSNQVTTGTDVELPIASELFSAFEFRSAFEGPLSGTWTGFSGELDLLSATGSTWTNDLALLLTTTPDLDFSAIEYQLGGNSTSLAPNGQIFHWSGGVGSESISESQDFAEPIVVDGLYLWVGNAWSAGTGRWDGVIALSGLGAQTGLISAIDPQAGTLEAGAAMTIDALFEAGSRAPGVYDESLIVTTDQAAQPELAIPVRLTVPGEAVLVPLPASLDFGEVVLGTTSAQVLTVENSGNVPLSLTQIATDEPDFSIAANSLEVPPFSSTTLAVTFAPTVVGPRAAELSFSTNDPATPQALISLGGVALPAPSISLEPAEVSLDLASGETTVTSFDILNTGDAPLTFSLPQFDGTSAATQRMALPPSRPGISGAELRSTLAPRTERETGPLLQQGTLPPARGSEGYRVEFDHFAAAAGSFELIDGPLSGQLDMAIADFVLDDATGQTFANDLTVLIATTPTPDLQQGDDILVQLGGSVTSLAPIVGRWGTGNSGAPGTPVQSTLLADSPIDLEDVYLLLGNSWLEGAGTWSGHIDIIGLAVTTGPILTASPVTGTVAPGETLSVELSISAEDLNAGSYTGIVQIESNDPGQPIAQFQVLLEVSGTPALELPEPSLDFGELFVGQQGTETLMLGNTGSAPLTISGLAVDQPGFVVDMEALDVEPGGTGQIPVGFTAASAGTATATLTFDTNDPDLPSVAIGLTALVLETPSLAIEPAAIDMALAAGSEGSFSLTLSNPGTGLLDFEFADFIGDPDTTSERVTGHAASHSERTVLATSAADEADARRTTGITSQTGATPKSDQPASFQLDLDQFLAFGGEFVPVASGLSGNLDRIDADFVLDQSTGLTWANDLTVLITSGPDLTLDSILIQAGGTFTLNPEALRLQWGMGSSGAPGTVVQTSLTLDSPLPVESAWVWIGSAWVEEDSGQWSGQIGLDGVSDRTPFIIEVSPVSGQIGPGQSTTIDLNLSAVDLIAGHYQDRLRLVSNDPLAPVRNIPATLAVSGQPDLVVDPLSLDFGEVFAGATVTSSLMIANPGTDDLVINSIQVNGEGFTADIDAFSVPPGSSASLGVNFFSAAAGSFDGEIVLVSNAADPVVTIDLAAQARNPGILTIDETSVIVEVPAGATTLTTLTLGNVGESPLVFEATSWQADDAQPAPPLSAPPALQRSPQWPAALMPASTGMPRNEVLLEEREVLWQQPPNGSFRITSSRSTELEAGLYAADSFHVSGAALVQGIDAFGFRFDDADRFDVTFESVVFHVYADADGQPAGSPDDGLNNHLFRFAGNIGTPGFSVEEEPMGFGTRTDVALDLLAATGQGLLLPEGRYWLVVHAVSASPDLYQDTWSLITSFDGAQAAQFIDLDNVFDIGGESWAPLAGVIPSHSANLAFRLEGKALNFLSVMPAQGIIDVDQTRELELLFDASDYQPGQYELSLVITTDSPATPEVVVPVTMVVTDEGGTGLLWSNLDGPPQAEIQQGQSFEIHGGALVSPERISSLGDLQMWAGFHAQDTHPAFWPESSWVAGELHEIDGEHASFVSLTGGHLPPGEYRYATRFRLDDGNFVYGGYHEAGGGFWNGLLHVSGRVTVLPAGQDGIFRDDFESD